MEKARRTTSQRKNGLTCSDTGQKNCCHDKKQQEWGGKNDDEEEVAENADRRGLAGEHFRKDYIEEKNAFFFFFTFVGILYREPLLKQTIVIQRVKSIEG